MTKIDITIGGKELTNIKRFSLVKSMKEIACSCSFEIAFSSIDTVPVHPFLYQNVFIKFDGKKVFTGHVLQVTPVITSSEKKINITCASNTHILTTSNLVNMAYPLEKIKLTFTQFYHFIAGLFFLNVKSHVKDTKIFDSITWSPKDSAFSILAKLAKQRGFILSTNANGEAVITKTTSGISTSFLSDKTSYFVDFNVDYNTDTIFTDYLGIIEGNEVTASSKIHLKNPFVFIPLVKQKTLTFKDIKEVHGKLALQSAIHRDMGQAITVNITLADWKTKGGEFWDINKLINILYPDFFIIKPTDFLIAQVTFSKTSIKENVKLQCVLPIAYDIDQKFMGLPWGL